MHEFRANLSRVSGLVNELHESQRILSSVIYNVNAFSEQSSATTEEVASLCYEQQQISVV
jgi:methyl-accepting chemotaxis protein